MKHLLFGLLPVIIFWFFEEKFGTLWGLIAAIVWSIGDCIYEYWRYKKLERMTLISTLLVVVLGGVSLLLDQSLFFKFQPSITEFIFAGLLAWQSGKENSWLMQMAQKTRPEVFNHGNEELKSRQNQMMHRMTRSLVIFLIIHGILMGLAAVYGTTGQWAFLKGVGFYVLFAIWFGFEYLLLRWKVRRK